MTDAFGVERPDLDNYRSGVAKAMSPRTKRAVGYGAAGAGGAAALGAGALALRRGRGRGAVRAVTTGQRMLR